MSKFAIPTQVSELLNTANITEDFHYDYLAYQTPIIIKQELKRAGIDKNQDITAVMQTRDDLLDAQYIQLNETLMQSDTFTSNLHANSSASFNTRDMKAMSSNAPFSLMNPLFGDYGDGNAGEILGRVHIGNTEQWCQGGVTGSAKFFSPIHYSPYCIIRGEGNTLGKHMYIATSEGNRFVSSSYAAFSNIFNNVAETFYDFHIMNLADKSRVAFGDFNGNGYDDIVVLRDRTEGLNPGWVYLENINTLDNIQLNSIQGNIADGGVPTTHATDLPFVFSKKINILHYSEIGAEIIAIGDFNGDGKDDILLYHQDQDTDSFRILDDFSSSNSPINEVNGIRKLDVDPQYKIAKIVKVGDFNGDGLADLYCRTSNGKNYIYLKSGTTGNNFYPMGSGFKGEIKLLFNTSSQDMSNINNINNINNIDEIVVSDFDGNGKSDFWISSNNPINGANYFFLSNGNAFQAYSTTPTEMLGTTDWCSETATGLNGAIHSGDFDGNGKYDIWCDTNRGIHFFGLSQIPSIGNSIVEPKIKVSVTDFKVRPYNIDECAIKNAPLYSQNVICDNRVRPDDKLECSAKSTYSKANIVEITGLQNWQKQQSQDVKIDFEFDQSRISFQSSDVGNIVNAALKNIDTNSFESSISTQVKSGECINMTMTSQHLTDVYSPYTAKMKLEGFDGTRQLSSSDLLSLAKQHVSSPVKINPLDASQVEFEVIGVTKLDLVYNGYSYAENCDFV